MPTSNKRLAISVVLLILASCEYAEQSKLALPQPAAKSVATTATATILDQVNVSDTVESESSAVPGEQLAHTAGARMVGEAAPIATMKTIDGDAIDLARYYGNRPVYIKFWATWCVPCRQQMPGFEKTYEALGGKIAMIALNIGLSDDEASVRKVRDIYKLKMPIVMDDGRLAQLFNLQVTPQHVLIGRDGRFAYFGHAENQQLTDAIQRVLSERGSASAQFAQETPVQKAFSPGDIVTALAVTTSRGTTIPLRGSGVGRVRAVVFFSSWCEWYLEKTRPSTAQACARARQDIELLAAEKNIVDWVGVAGGPWATASDLADYQKSHHISIPMGLDTSGTLFHAFGIRDIPTIALIDARGKLLQIISPGTTDLKAAIRATIGA